MRDFLCVCLLIAAAYAAPEGRVVGGQDAARDQFPYAVSLRYCLSGVCQHTCGGAIISQSWILTAAHCLTDAPGLGSYQILAGEVSLSEGSYDRQLISLSHAFINPNYQGGLNPHDIAIVKLATPLVFSSAVQAVELPDQGYEYDNAAVLAGWGSIGGSETPIMPDNLQYANVSVVPIATCRSALDSLLGNTPHPLDDTANICSGPLTGGIATCTGDSGGPLVQTVGRDLLLGTASWGLTPCGITGAPSVFSKISAYTNWILSLVDEPLLKTM